MNILYITNGLSEGGVETLLYDLSIRLIAKGNQVAILVLNRNEIALKEFFKVAGVKIIVGKYDTCRDIRNIFLIKSLISNYDVIHSHLYPTQLYVVLANMLLFKGKKQLITTEHNVYNHRRDYPWFRIFDRWMYKKYTYIVGIEKNTSKALYEWIGRDWANNKIQTITNGIDILKYRAAKRISRQELGIADSNIVLIMVARFNAQKDQETVIRSLLLLPDNVHVLFIGTGETLSQMQQLTICLSLCNRVHFLGHRSDVANILKICDVGILSSHWEGFGLVAVEYMASGLPVLASNVKGLNDVVGCERLLFEVGNQNDLAQKIMNLVADKNYCQQIKIYCSQRADKFSIDQTVENYIALYTKAVDDNI